MWINILPRLLVMSNFMVLWKSGVKNWELRIEEFDFVSDTERMSTFLGNKSQNYQIYFG